MITLFYQVSKSETSLSSLRFISSFSSFKNPGVFRSRDDDFSNSCNPFQLINHLNQKPKPTIKEIKITHTQCFKVGFTQSDIFVANSLADLYCKSGSMGDALCLFEEIPHPNVVSWNLMISGYNQSLRYEGSWGLFRKMQDLGFEPDRFTYGSVLSACAASRNVHGGEQVYGLVVKNGFFLNGYVRSGMIDVFLKSFCLEEALRVFRDVWCKNVVCWNAIIAGAVRSGENWLALDIFHEMLCGVLMPNSYTFPSVLTACAALGELQFGRGLHGWVVKFGFDEDNFIGTAIVDLYVKCGIVDDALKVFSRMKIHNVVSWTAIISGFVQMEDSVSALEFLKKMKVVGIEINKYTVTSILTACAKPEMKKEASQIHCWILKFGFYSDPTVRDSLINMYSKGGEIDLSEMLFWENDGPKNVDSWAVIISGFAQNHNSERTIEMFCKMCREGLRPEKFCSSSVLSIIESIDMGRQIHGYIFKDALVFDVAVGSALFTMYSKCGSLAEAYKIFKQIHEKDEVSWTSMITGFADHGYPNRALNLLQDMMDAKYRPDQVTIAAILTACSSLPSLWKGKEVHGYALRVGIAKDTVVSGALVNMYSKCRFLTYARRIFESMPRKDLVTWSSLISGYSKNEYVEDSLMLFHKMIFVGLETDAFVISSLLGMTAKLTKLKIGKQLHARIVKVGLDSDPSVGSPLVEMYSKCGNVEESQEVFDTIEQPDLVTWTSMIVGYAQHGKGSEALRVYDLMREKGIKPDLVAFVGVLSACSHNGMVEEGYFHLNSMTQDYGINPGLRHYACMVDLLGRSGRLKEAKTFINNMPIQPDALVWGTLLAACKVHGNVELGKLAAKRVHELEPSDSGTYVSLSNILANEEQWEEVLNVRSSMTDAEVTKETGWSSI
ncbi:hypothetical protein GIB67_012014 [Kingdonia uniflora]|uniref:Pentatricopeptide repeat-containing protein n=1 Tax=Kingdonia uniflora TaxID=39325 RepID=A0A7J7M047_9MAGN|nr:hypothetical protein GIB67_012014 [Kingdonia uniflora]